MYTSQSIHILLFLAVMEGRVSKCWHKENVNPLAPGLDNFQYLVTLEFVTLIN
jgi:hypothetical protein